MTRLLRFIQLLAVAVWVGGLVFFAFVLAPAAFHTLPSPHEAGLIVGATLRIFDGVGLVCGLLYLTAGLLRRRETARTLDRLLVAAMLFATAYIHFSLLPSMDRDRAVAAGDMDALPLAHPARVHFDRLHRQSEQIEGGVLSLGLGVIFLLAAERAPARPELIQRST